MILDSFRALPDWFSHKPYGIHGIAHVTRVLVWADRIAQAMLDAGKPIDLDVVRWAAVVHDVGRHNDGRDPEHGTRSTLWLDEHRATLFAGLDAAQINKIQHCCTWHVQSDQDIPEWTNELTCLKDADGLDRVRIFDLDVKYLRTAAARSHAVDAQVLLDASSSDQPADPWERVRTAALERGWWR